MGLIREQHVQLATGLLVAMRAALEADQGARFRAFLHDEIRGIHFEARAEDPSYLGGEYIGAGEIGKECARSIWYSFRWLSLRVFAAKALLIFSRGVLEEPRFTALLRLLPGVHVWTHERPGKQFTATVGPVKGKLDAVAKHIEGFGDHLVPVEFKSHGASFTKLAREGVRETKPEHFAQVQFYLGAYGGLPKALYFACEKESDDLHLEVIDFDRAFFDGLIARAVAIVNSPDPPPRLAHASPSYFKCKFCDHREVCFSLVNTDSARFTSCRACTHVRFDGENFEKDSSAHCVVSGQTLTHKAQFRGCANHRPLPVLR